MKAKLILCSFFSLLFLTAFISEETPNKTVEKQEVAILVTSDATGAIFIQMSYDNRNWDECKIEATISDYLRQSCQEHKKEKIKRL